MRWPDGKNRGLLAQLLNDSGGRPKEPRDSAGCGRPPGGKCLSEATGHRRRSRGGRDLSPASAATARLAGRNATMTGSSPPRPLALGLFEKRIDGDNCLMELARRRFQQTGMGAEMHACTPDQLDWLMKFRPEDVAVVVHLARDFNF